MLKTIKYETKDINDVVLDLADEIKNGWKLYSFGWPNVEISCRCNPDIAVEVTLRKEF
jgi:hypothetical protein